jgi:hypothetical protein
VNSAIIVPTFWHAPIISGSDNVTEEIRSDKGGSVFRQKAYLASMRKELEGIIEQLPLLNHLQKEFLRFRWLDQVLWMEKRANHAKVLYYILRMTTIVCGVIIPALVSLGYHSENPLFWVVFVLSLLVAISAALEEFLRYGAQWRHYRLKVELLKNEGWLFFQLSGRRYRHFLSYAEAYPRFARRVEKWNRLEVDEYLTEVAQDKGDEDEDEDEDEDKHKVKESADNSPISRLFHFGGRRTADKRRRSR